jgi:hypothetical protein
VCWEGFDPSHDLWVPRRDITPKALIAYEEFLRSFDGLKSNLQFHTGHSKEGYTQTQRMTFKKKLASFMGENGEYSVLGNSDNRRTLTGPLPAQDWRARMNVGQEKRKTSRLSRLACGD